jgi:hypothetical protein
MGYTGRDIGRRILFDITAPHDESTQGTGADTKTLRSLPVRATDTVTKSVSEGSFPLNKTAMGYLVGVLGNNSDKWVKHSFEAVIVNQNNPSTSQAVLSWSIIQETIK